MIAYDAFFRDHKLLSREEFLDKVDVPHLLLGAPLQQSRDAGTAGFMTVKFTKENVVAVNGVERLLPVQKRPGSNAFAMMITLGRANNNDLVVPDQRISKFHAYFRSAGADWTICDANSRNGTFVDGAPVPTDSGLPVVSGARIKLAKSLELVFLDPAGLYERLQQG